MEYTTNLNLKKPSYADAVDIQVLNDNFDIIDEAIGEGVSSGTGTSSVMIGATSESDGSAGLVPAPAAGDQSKYLRGDGTWSGEIDVIHVGSDTPPDDATIWIDDSDSETFVVEVSEMVGATSTADGEAGTVPAPTKSDYNKYLRGDGTWVDIEIPDISLDDIATVPSVDEDGNLIYNQEDLDNYVSSTPILAAQNSWYKGTTDKTTITAIRIVDEYTATGSETESWNADADGAGSIKCYVSDAALIIAGNGSASIKMNTDSTRCFHGTIPTPCDAIGITLPDFPADALSSFPYAIAFKEDENIFCFMSTQPYECNSWSDVNNYAGTVYQYIHINTDAGTKASIYKLIDGSWVCRDDYYTEQILSACTEDEIQSFIDEGLIESASDIPGLAMISQRMYLFLREESAYELFILASTHTLTERDTGNTVVLDEIPGFSNLDSISGMSLLDTSEMTKADEMFAYCQFGNILGTGLDVSSWDMSSCESTFGMFKGCSSLTTLDVSSWDVSNLQTMQFMFMDCAKLEDMDVSLWNTSSLRNTRSAFRGCKVLDPEISGWDTTNLFRAAFMFKDFEGSSAPDVAGWDVENVNSAYMFAGSTIENLDFLADWGDTLNYPGDPVHIFENCVHLTRADLGTFHMGSYGSMSYAFAGCTNLEEVTGLDNLVAISAGNKYAYDHLFKGCENLRELDLTNFDTTTATYVCGMFDGMLRLEKITLGEKFTFLPDGANADEDGVIAAILPTPSADYIEGADGYWYTEDGTAYAPADVPSLTAATYYAVDPTKEV